MCRMWDVVRLFVPGRKVQRRRDGRKIVGVKGTGRVLPGTGQSAGCAVRADGLGEGAAAWRVCAEQEAFKNEEDPSYINKREKLA